MLNGSRVRKSVCALGATIGMLFALSLLAQGSFGRLFGTVTDQTGAVVPGAVVIIMDTERGVARNLVTDATGGFDAPTLVPSTYTIRIQARGFKTLDRPNILLEVGKEIRVDLTPQPGEQSQTVTVEAAAPLVDTTSATLGGAMNNADINDLPLMGAISRV